MLEDIHTVQIRNLEERFKLSMDEAEKRNGQRFDAQQEAVSIAMASQEKAVLAAMSAAEKAVTKAEMAAEKRFESVNEFRAALTDQATRLATKEDIVQLKELIELQRARIDKIENASSNLQGRLWMLAFVFAIIQVLINIAPKILAQ